ncbi:MAG: TonB-dependent receptor [Treponema sp.]|nr:TonB-dependent receptor [Treponema sp.]
MKTKLKARLLITSLAFLLYPSQAFSQNQEASDQEESKITLPQVVTYLPSSLETKITYDQEALEEMHLSDLPQLLESTGIQLLSYGPYGLEQKPSIRGFTDETVRVVIDGICVNNPMTGCFDFSAISLENVEKIEIIKGGFTEGTDDEGAVGGVIYITTKKQNIKKTFVSDTKLKTLFYQTSPLDTISQSLNYSGPLTDWLFIDTGLKATYARNDYRDNDASIIDGQSNIQLTGYFGDGNSLSINNIFYGGYKHTPDVQYSTNQGILQDYNNNHTISLFTPNLCPLFTLKNTLTWLCNNRLYDDVAESSKHYVNTLKYNATADFYPWHNIKENAGLTLDYTYLNSTNDGIHSLFSGVIKETTKISLGKYFSLSIPLTAKFSGQNFAFVPKLGLSLSFKYLSVTLNGYRLILFPIMDDLYWQGAGFQGNPDLKPEKGWGADLVFDFKNKIMPLTLSFFTNYYESKILWTQVNNVWTTANLASAFYFGINLDFNLNLFQDHLIIKGNGEYLYTALLDKANPYTYGKRIMWTPDLTASLSISLNFQPVLFTLQANYTGLRYCSNMNITYLKPYTLVNAIFELKNLNHLKPYIRVDNLLNTQYESIEGYPMPGISLTIGLKMTF